MRISLKQDLVNHPRDGRGPGGGCEGSTCIQIWNVIPLGGATDGLPRPAPRPPFAEASGSGCRPSHPGDQHEQNQIDEVKIARRRWRRRGPRLPSPLDSGRRARPPHSWSPAEHRATPGGRRSDHRVRNASQRDDVPADICCAPAYPTAPGKKASSRASLRPLDDRGGCPNRPAAALRLEERGGIESEDGDRDEC